MASVCLRISVGIALCTLVLATGGRVSVVDSVRWQVRAAAMQPAGAPRRAADGRPPPQACLLLALFALQISSVAWALFTVARQLLWTSMVALSQSAADSASPRQSATATFAVVSWTLFALATASTAAAVAGQLVAPIVLVSADLQQQAIDATFIVNAVLIVVMEFAVAVGFEHLSSIARKQVRFQRDVLSHPANGDLTEAMDDLAKRTRQMALAFLCTCPFSLIFLTVVGSFSGTRQAVLPLHSERSRVRPAQVLGDAHAAGHNLRDDAAGHERPGRPLVPFKLPHSHICAATGRSLLDHASSGSRSLDSSLARDRAPVSDVKVHVQPVEMHDAKASENAAIGLVPSDHGMPQASPAAVIASIL
jgi:hypothetical protein